MGLRHYTDVKRQILDLVNPDNFDDGLGKFGNYHHTDNPYQKIGKIIHAEILDFDLDPNKKWKASRSKPYPTR